MQDRDPDFEARGHGHSTDAKFSRFGIGAKEAGFYLADEIVVLTRTAMVSIFHLAHKYVTCQQSYSIRTIGMQVCKSWGSCTMHHDMTRLCSRWRCLALNVGRWQGPEVLEFSMSKTRYLQRQRAGVSGPDILKDRLTTRCAPTACLSHTLPMQCNAHATDCLRARFHRAVGKMVPW